MKIFYQRIFLKKGVNMLIIYINGELFAVFSSNDQNELDNAGIIDLVTFNKLDSTTKV
jgi:hypothetical protein